MFFSWYNRNRHFKQKSNLSGQIFPVLLICIAGLLVAAIVTIGIGEGAKSKTCASNAADAGSLATASYWAGAFNKLVDRNKNQAVSGGDNFGFFMTKENKYRYYKRMHKYYLEMRIRYGILKVYAESYLSNNSPNGAEYWTREALRLANLAKGRIIIPDPNTHNGDCTIWTTQGNEGGSFEAGYAVGTGAYYNVEASKKLFEAAKCIGAFYALSYYMKLITDFFKSEQGGNFCGAKSFMDDAYESAMKKGQSYALNNSCTTSKLTDALGDDFDFQIRSGNIFNGSTATYSWPTGPSTTCSITATVDLPNIQDYYLRHTIWNYPMDKSLYNVRPSCICDTIADPPEWLCGDRLVKSTATLGDDTPDDETDNPCNPVYPDDPFNIFAAFYLMESMLIVKNYFVNLASAGQEIFDKTFAGKACCDKDHHHCTGWITTPCSPTLPAGTPCCTSCPQCEGYEDLCPNYLDYYHNVPAGAEHMQDQLIIGQNCVITWLTAIINNQGTDNTIKTLRYWNTEVWNNVWPLPDAAPITPVPAASGWGFPPAPACPFSDPLDPGTEPGMCDFVTGGYMDGVTKYPGMGIIDIDSVVLEQGDKWETTCTVIAKCGEVTTTSTSTSKFYGSGGGKGGNIGLFNDDYYPEIIKTE